MERFTRDGLALAYVDEGPRVGAPVLLIHGFASTARVNWIEPGWVQTLTDAGHRVIALDNRGHGQSDKPHAPDAYHPSKMAGDALALLDHLGLRRATLFGYSMGARIAAFAALDHPDRVEKLILGGLGLAMVEGSGNWDTIAAAMRAPSLDDVPDERGRMFRAFADKTGGDRVALAACIERSRAPLTPAQMSTIATPTLIGVGTKDPIAGAPQPLAAMMPDAIAFDIEGRDHMLAVGDKQFKRAVLSFLSGETADLQAQPEALG